ncbi:hypothetical protein BO71DRAFT_100057 [Aspergillus ellipticus CBS 707.79]|uniref:Uncharacterized protein n=1 Tax=Aspergillus ellipticus CBS 707.79 TaxID=1448320 RepID=A0A319EFH3_9EURO|nr:hypothetical protein BO71DRAFT_100057 [Aspergillus ellipticus CBS 707.79]
MEQATAGSGPSIMGWHLGRSPIHFLIVPLDKTHGRSRYWRAFSIQHRHTHPMAPVAACSPGWTGRSRRPRGNVSHDHDPDHVAARGSVVSRILISSQRGSSAIQTSCATAAQSWWQRRHRIPRGAPSWSRGAWSRERENKENPEFYERESTPYGLLLLPQGQSVHVWVRVHSTVHRLDQLDQLEPSRRAVPWIAAGSSARCPWFPSGTRPLRLRPSGMEHGCWATAGGGWALPLPGQLGSNHTLFTYRTPPVGQTAIRESSAAV